jgi:hypothetical protein
MDAELMWRIGFAIDQYLDSDDFNLFTQQQMLREAEAAGTFENLPDHVKVFIYDAEKAAKDSGDQLPAYLEDEVEMSEDEELTDIEKTLLGESK